MFWLRYTTEQEAFAIQFVKAAKELGSRKEFNGSDDDKILGTIAQVAIVDYYRQPRPEPMDGNDGGKDMILEGAKIDIKAVKMPGNEIQNWHNHKVVFSQYQQPEDKRPDIYLFAYVSERQRIVGVCGWLGHEEFIDQKIGEFVRKGAVANAGKPGQFTWKTDNFLISQLVLTAHREIFGGNYFQRQIRRRENERERIS